jgi:hypothetical protein
MIFFACIGCNKSHDFECYRTLILQEEGAKCSHTFVISGAQYLTWDQKWNLEHNNYDGYVQIGGLMFHVTSSIHCIPAYCPEY